MCSKALGEVTWLVIFYFHISWKGIRCKMSDEITDFLSLQWDVCYINPFLLIGFFTMQVNQVYFKLDGESCVDVVPVYCLYLWGNSVGPEIIPWSAASELSLFYFPCLVLSSKFAIFWQTTGMHPAQQSKIKKKEEN